MENLLLYVGGFIIFLLLLFFPIRVFAKTIYLDIVDFIKYFGKQPQKIKIMKEDYARFEQLTNKVENEKNRDSKNYANKNDNVCPKCHSHNVNDKFARIKGRIDGDFFIGIGSIEGKIDTKEVNKCHDCGNEWKKYKTSYHYSKDVKRDLINDIQYVLSRYYEAHHCKFKKNDLEEKFNSKAEKSKYLISDFSSSNRYKIEEISKNFKDIHIETIRRLFNELFDLLDYEREKFYKHYNKYVLTNILGLKCIIDDIKN